MLLFNLTLNTPNTTRSTNLVCLCITYVSTQTTVYYNSVGTVNAINYRVAPKMGWCVKTMYSLDNVGQFELWCHPTHFRGGVDRQSLDYWRNYTVQWSVNSKTTQKKKTRKTGQKKLTVDLSPIKTIGQETTWNGSTARKPRRERLSQHVTLLLWHWRFATYICNWNFRYFNPLRKTLQNRYLEWLF